MLHEIKIQKEYADAVLSGEKNFEVRYNDRNYRKGDFVRFKVVDGIYCVPHKLHNAEYIITYVLRSFAGLAQGYVAFGIKEVRVEFQNARQVDIDCPKCGKKIYVRTDITLTKSCYFCECGWSDTA